MEISAVEKALNFTFPARHKQAILDPDDSIHRRVDFLTIREKRDFGDILGLNLWLRSPKCGDPWPDFLIAFASNGCGDYFAYDTRQQPVSIIYIDPDRSVLENISDSSDDKLKYDSFESWYESCVNRA